MTLKSSLLQVMVTPTDIIPPQTETSITVFPYLPTNQKTEVGQH